MIQHGRTWCEVAGRRFETEGPAPIYKLATLLWLHGHRGKDFEVWDALAPLGKPGGLAMTGKVRNWARLVKGKSSFDRQANPAPEFTPDEVDLIAHAAGRALEAAGTDSPAPGNARTAQSRPPDGPDPARSEGRPLCRRFHRPETGGGIMLTDSAPMVIALGEAYSIDTP